MTNNLKYSLAILFLMVFIFSCKKKDDNAPQNTSSTTGSVNTSTPSSYYGVMFSNQFDIISSGTVIPSGGITTAYFASNPLINTIGISDGFSGNSLNAGTVTLNGTVLQRTLTSGSYFFNDSTSALFNSPFHWSVTGANGVPTITYTYSATRPAYTGYNALPDTIKLSQSNVLQLTGISGADEIVINVFAGGYITKNISGNSTSVTLTASELSSLSATTGGFFIITISKNAYQAFGGQSYKFKTGYELYKNIVVQ